MIKRLLAILLAMFVATPAFAGDGTGPVHVSAGTIVDLGVLKSKYADPRRVVVWLPPGYSKRGPKYSVLYMHDGQNLFDKATAGYGMEWEIDKHLSKLILCDCGIGFRLGFDLERFERGSHPVRPA